VEHLLHGVFYVEFLNVGAKKMYGTFFHVSPEGVKHMDMLNNLFALLVYVISPDVEMTIYGVLF